MFIPGKFWCKGKKCKEIVQHAIFDKEDQEISWFCPNCGFTSQVSLKRKKGYKNGKERKEG